MKACPGDGSGQPSRSALARELCERESWRGPSGRLCCASARKLLPKLAASLGVLLPAPEARLEGADRRAESGYPDRALACGLSALGEVSLDPVPDGERRTWESMVESHHPKGCSPFIPPQLTRISGRGKSCLMRIGTRQLRPDTSAWLKGALESGVCTRSSLATELCERENWRNPLGAPCLASARTALPKLAAKLGLALPEALPMGGATAASRAAPPHIN